LRSQPEAGNERRVVIPGYPHGIVGEAIVKETGFLAFGRPTPKALAKLVRTPLRLGRSALGACAVLKSACAAYANAFPADIPRRTGVSPVDDVLALTVHCYNT
jgi:hypothetical protein